MNASITVWTSHTTDIMESQVARIIRATRDYASVYDSITSYGCDSSEVEEKINDTFDRLVKLTMADATMHIVAIIPLWDDNVHAQIKTLADACASVKHKITLHVIGLCQGLCKVLSAHCENTQSNLDESGISELKTATSEATFGFSFSLIDDYASNGAPMGFNVNSLSKYIALFELSLIQDYYSVLSPSLLSSHQGYNISVGLSSLSLDKGIIANQLLGRGFLSALDEVGINNGEVDAQKAVNISERFLSSIENRYPKLYERSIKPLYREKGMDYGEAVACASEILDQDIDDLKDEIIEVVRYKDLSLPEKQAFIALTLGRDDEIIRGIQYEHEGKLLDDACDDPINLYVEAFNNNCSDSGLLPVRGDFAMLKKYIFKEKDSKPIESIENKWAMNPLPEIKRLKQTILNTTAFIRGKTDELNALIDAEDHRSKVDKIKQKWNRPSGSLADVEYKEQPLEEKYEPSPLNKPKGTVDLRKFMSPVRNQKDLGSCSSFAVVAMYEALMNRCGSNANNEMSPAFLYYHTNIITGRPTGGSNYFEQFEVLGKYGVCYEHLCRYNSENPSVVPTKEAHEDAINHRVIKAKQIPLVDGADKNESIKRNHFLLTSALSEGYPIGISLKIYENFGKDGAFISHPEDNRDSKEDGWHAMVIVGYSEENGFYIVRNSWGEDFGEEGYCYIPMTYIDDLDYMDFACIITGISETATGEVVEIPTTLANFAATESEIRIAAIRNVISKAKLELKNDQKLYSEYYKYYQKLVQCLTMPKVQKEIREYAEFAKDKHYVDIESTKTELEESFVSKYKEFKKLLKKSIVIIFCLAIISGIISWGVKSKVFMILSVSLLTLGIMAWLGYKWNIRRHRKELQDELDDVAMKANRQKLELLELQIKFHVAGMWLSKFHNLSIEIGRLYDRLVSFNSTLRGWQKEYTSLIKNEEKDSEVMFRKLDATPLLSSFFDSNRNEIVGKIDLIKVFENYQVSENSLEESHSDLQNEVKNASISLLEDFKISDFLLGKNYPYLQPVDIEEEIAYMLSVGQPSFRCNLSGDASMVKILMVNVSSDNLAQWDSKVSTLFPLQPIRLNLEDDSNIVLFTLQPMAV